MQSVEKPQSRAGLLKFRDWLLDEVIGGNQIFSVDFKKRDGTIVSRTGRLGVRKYLAGGEKPFRDKDYFLITYYDFKQGGYRSFDIRQVIRIGAHGKVWYFHHATDW